MYDCWVFVSANPLLEFCFHSLILLILLLLLEDCLQYDWIFAVVVPRVGFKLSAVMKMLNLNLYARVTLYGICSLCHVFDINYVQWNTNV